MDAPTNQPARDTRWVSLRIGLAVVIVGLSVIDLLVSSQAWVFVATLGIMVIAVAFAVRMSWARPVMGIVVVVAAIGYAFSAINGGGPFAIANALIWGVLFLTIWYVNGNFKRTRPGTLA